MDRGVGKQLHRLLISGSGGCKSIKKLTSRFFITKANRERRKREEREEKEKKKNLKVDKSEVKRREEEKRR